MKKRILFTLLITSGFLFAQDNPVDKMTTTKTKVETKTEDGVTYQNKIKVVTKQEQEVKTDPKASGQIDADRSLPPVKTTKMYFIDNDKDPFYDEVTKVVYYQMEGNKYTFKKSNKGFVVTYFNNDEKPYWKAVKSKENPYYFVNNGTKTGIGYFDDNDKFVIEYYDAKDDITIMEIYNNTSF